MVIDPYDDGFESLKELFKEHEPPSFIKEATIMSTEDLNLLPDHVFAVVVLGQDKPMRKFACSDKAHTAVNILYLLNNSDHLPHSAKIKAASNLLKACQHFGLQPPGQLVKMAQGGKALIKGDGAEIIVSGGNGEKTSEVIGTRDMPVTRPGETVKKASVMDSPYVEVDYYDPIIKTASENPMFSVMNGQLSLKPYDNVIRARDHFEEQYMYMHPRDRHEYCIKLAARADILGIPISDTIRKYGSTTYASRGSMKVAFEQRSQLWSSLDKQEGDSVARQLLEKRAEFDPETFVETLAELDAQTGIDQYWGEEIPDPWMSVFDVEKVAEWSWNQAGEHLTEEALKRLCVENSDLMKDKFGEDIAKSMVKNPTAIFDSLPLEQKRVIARMAQQRESGL